jgi:FAD:protein FMN transferase
MYLESKTNLLHKTNLRRYLFAGLVLLAPYAESTMAQSQAVTLPTLQLYSTDHPAMGTIYSLYIYSSSAEDAATETGLVFEEIDRLEALLSNFRDSSELSRINREASDFEVTTDPETFNFLQKALGWSAQSDGAFDITVGKLMKAWGFFRSSGHHPSEAELLQVRTETGWKNVHLDASHRTVHFLSPGIELDPGGIGKGYAIERAIAILRSEHVPAALLSAGSSTIYALGAPPGASGWKILVPALGDKGKTLSTVILRDNSLSTANCAEKHFIEDKHLYCHIMNPHTLRPVEGMLQVTVVAESATDSDALSNVLFVLGLKKGRSVLNRMSRNSALIITGTSHTRCEFIRWPGVTENGYCASRMVTKNK